MSKARPAWLGRVRRVYHRRLLAPLLRGRHPPEHTARGAMIGLGAAFTPLVGIQMPVVLLIWFVVRRFFPRWDFNLVVAIAWTWVTNVFTAPAVYYVLLVTGRLALGRWDRIRGFETFERNLEGSMPAANGPVETVWVTLIALIDKFGLPMFVGCVPWVLLMGWLGYRLSFSLVVSVRARRARRRASGARRRARRAGTI